MHQHYNTDNELSSNQLKKMKLKDKKLFITTQNSFQLLDVETEEWMALGKAEGVDARAIKDFDFSDDKLWLITSKYLLAMDLEQLPQNQLRPKLYMDSLVVSGQQMSSELLPHTFDYNQNHFSFYPSFRSVEYMDETSIQYRIVGFEDEWRTVPASIDLIEYRSLPPGDYQLQLKAIYRNRVLDQYDLSFVVSKAFWNTWWFYILVFVLLGALVSFAFSIRIQKLQQRNDEKLERQRMATELLDSKLKALRSQMNPHFIFNALNSIQDLILQEDTERSYDYIVLFSELVRSTLNYSEKDFIPIEKELQFLKVYLSLENLRFKKDFEYGIHYDGEREIEIPSLLVQPFIENALLHGLLHKQGAKKLDVRFELGEHLLCTITDNGIGREKAAKISKRQSEVHESFSLKAIRKRLDILNEQFGLESDYSISDRIENGQVAGTIVKIRIPYIRRF